MAVVKTRNLCKSYDGREVLKGINIDVARGEAFTIIGPTGAGKTTLLRLLDLLEIPTSGNVYFEKLDVTGSRRFRLEARRRMAFVLQKPVMFNATVYQNVTCGLKWRGNKRGNIRQSVGDVLEMVGLTDYKDRDARTLSGGEAQRVAIARAMVVNPEVLLLDEPTANLDPVSTSKIEEIISRIISQHNTTVIMSTHDLPQGQRLAHRMAVMVNGEILQVGDSKQVFNLPVNREVAEFVGVDNIIDGIIVSRDGDLVTIDVDGKSIEAVSEYNVGERVSVCIRPEEVILAPSPVSSSARNSFHGEVVQLISRGSLSHVVLDCGFPLTAMVTSRSAVELGLESGRKIYAGFKATAIHVVKT